MLARWTLRNFKSYSANNSFVLSPLTLFRGANSSGKSSVLQSMLLIKQTLEHSPVDRVIALNGPLVQLGTFSDILNNQAPDTPQEIGIGWDVDHAASSNAAVSMYLNEFQVARSRLDFVFDTAGPVDERATLELQPGLKSARMSAVVTDGSGQEHDVRVEIERVTRRGRRIQYDSSTLADDAKLRFRIKDIDAETWDAAAPGNVPSTVVGANINHFSPSALIVRYDRNLRLAKQAAIVLTDSRAPTRFRMAPVKLSRAVLSILQEALSSFTSHPRFEIISRLFQMESKELTVETIAQRYKVLPLMTRRQVREALAGREGVVADQIYKELGRDRTVSLARVEQLARVTSASEHYFRFLLRYLGPLRADPRLRTLYGASLT